MEELLDQLETAIKEKDKEALIPIIIDKINDSNRMNIIKEYKDTYNRDLFEDFSKNFKSEFLELILGAFKTPLEYDTDLLYKALDKFNSDKDIISEIICFRSQKQIDKIKEKYQEKYGKDLIEDLKKKTSGDYQKIILNLLNFNRNKNTTPHLEQCKTIAEELYKAGEGKIGTNEEVFINYFTILSKEELLAVCKAYHRKYSKTMLNVLHNEFSGNEKKLLECILYSIFSPSEYFAREIMDSIKGIGTNDAKLIRCVLTRYNYDMKRIKKYFKKIYQKNLLDEIKDEVTGSYGKLLEELINKSD